MTVRSSEAQLRSQEAGVTQSQASLRQNQVNLAHTVIESPIDGLVISRNVDVGQTVAASMSAPTLFVLAADLTKMQVLASLDESDVGRIRPGQAVRFRVDAFPTDEFTGSVTQVRLQPTTVQNVVTYQTVIDVPNPGLKLKPGMTANVNIEIARREDVVRVPNTALRFRPTAEIFAALGQTPPPGGAGGGGGRGRGAGAGPDTRNAPPATAPAAQQPAAAQPAAQQPERRPATAAPGSADRATGRSTSSGSARRRLGAADGARRGWRRPSWWRTWKHGRAHGQHDARGARAFHGAHARARLYASGRWPGGCRTRTRRPGSGTATAGSATGGAAGGFGGTDVRRRSTHCSHRWRRLKPSVRSG